MQNDKNPFMPFVEDFEAEAEAFLRKYCKKVLDSPQATPIREIAQKQMNLDIVDTEGLSPDDSIQGAIAFTAGIIEVYDWSSEEYIGYEVKQPTVFLDSAILNPGRKNNTLAHECYHWYKHRAYFRYQNTHNLGSEFAFRCLSARQRDRNEQWSDIEKMEWQARTIAPKILMPRCTVRTLLSECLGNERNKNIQQSALKAVVEEIAEVYKVSRQSAAIRVSELGYPQAVELYDSETVVIDRQHRRSSTAAKFHQQPIDEVSAFRLYMSDEFLKATLDTGAFCYAEGFFVLRDEKYVLFGGDALYLTEYAKLHLSECTLDFSYKLVCNRTSVRDVQYMFRADTEYKKLPSYDSNTQNMDEYNKALAKALDDADSEFQAQLKRNRMVNETTSQRMCKYMDAAHWNTSIFQDKTHLAPMDYTRVYQNHKFKVPSYTAMAVGLELTLHETEDALRLSGLGYQYEASAQEYVNRRKVKWLKHLPRTAFSQGALYESGSAMSLFTIKNYADEFLASLDTGFKKTAMEDEDESVGATAEEIKQSTKDFILKELSRNLKGYALESFVADLLDAMGYRTELSPQGGDSGIDITAYKDELPPRILVQVKSQDGDIRETTIQSLKGAMREGDYGLFISLSGYTKNARKYLDSTPIIRGIDGDELATLVLKYYENLSPKYKKVIPLERVYIPVPADE